MAARSDPDFARAMGRVLRAARKRVGLKAGTLANELGVSEQTVSNWETGRALPALANLRAVARLLRVEAHRIVAAAERASAMSKVMMRDKEKSDEYGDRAD
jgi:DNA-binding XRE family transcriptional regulator